MLENRIWTRGVLAAARTACRARWTLTVLVLSATAFSSDRLVSAALPLTFTEVDRFEAPSDDPGGLTFDGNHLFMSSMSGSRTIFELETDGTLVNSFLAPSTTFVSAGAFDGFGNPNALAFDGSHLFVADFSGTIFEIDTAGTTIFNMFTISFQPGGMTSDGAHLFISDAGTNTVAVFTTAGVHVRDFAIPFRAYGLSFLDDCLFGIDTFSQLVIQFTTEGEPVNSFAGPHNSVAGLGGITFAGPRMFIAEVSDPDRFNPPIIPGTIIELVPNIDDALLDLALVVEDLDLALIAAPNDRASAGRRNAMFHRLIAAGNAVNAGDIEGAIEQLLSLLDKLDGDPRPPDWMVDSPEKAALREAIELIVALLWFL